MLKTLSISLAYTGLIGYAPFLFLLRPQHVTFRPCFKRSSKFDFSVEHRSWEVVTGSWMGEGRLQSVNCVGCNLTCRMTAGEGNPDEEGDQRIIDRFIAVPPQRSVFNPGAEDATSERRQEDDRSPADWPLEVVYDLTTLPPLTIPFYTHFLLQKSIDGVFTIPNLRLDPSARSSMSSTQRPRGVRVVVKRQQEAEWIKKGLELIKLADRQLVDVQVLPSVPETREEGGQKKVSSGVSSGVGGLGSARAGGLWVPSA